MYIASKFPIYAVKWTTHLCFLLPKISVLHIVHTYTLQPLIQSIISLPFPCKCNSKSKTLTILSSEKMKKGIFKQKPRTPIELVRHARELLIFIETKTGTTEKKREEKLADLNKTILEIRTVLFGNGESEPSPEACSQLTQEFFREDTFRLLILYLPKLKLGTRQDATHVIANLQRQRVNSRIIASQYLENNLDLVDILIPGYEKDGDIALTYGATARECIRHQSVARHVLESEHMKKFFEYIQIPNFEIASDAVATFKELLTRHKSTVAEFLSTNFDWFFKEYNSQLLESTSYFTRRHAIKVLKLVGRKIARLGYRTRAKCGTPRNGCVANSGALFNVTESNSLKLLGDMLLDRSNSAVMVRYVSSLDNMRIHMNLLRDSNKTIQFETFHVFKLFVANQNKPPEVVSILVTNKQKLLQFFANFNIDKADEHFEADKQQVIHEIITVEHKSRPCTSLDNSEVPC